MGIFTGKAHRTEDPQAPVLLEFKLRWVLTGTEEPSKQILWFLYSEFQTMNSIAGCSRRREPKRLPGYRPTSRIAECARFGHLKARFEDYFMIPSDPLSFPF